MVFKHFNSIEEMNSCHIVFINLPNPDKMKQALSILKSKGVLTVSDHKGFLQAGGMVCFLNKENKIQFQINPELAKSEKITISSKLLRLAKMYP